MDRKAIVDRVGPLQVAVEAMTHKAIFLDPKLLRPLPQSLWGHACSRCDKTQSVWELFDLDSSKRKGEPMCSLCWLYESEWGKERRGDIDDMVRAVEIQANGVFKKTDDGRLWSCQEADRILGSIAVTSRIVSHRSMLQAFGGDDGP